jgi:DNA-binding GntR family transcriptional regulator
MAEMIGVPAYQQVAADLRKQISDGKIRVGEPIPSAAKLQERYNVSSTVVQRAINELRMEGLLQGQPGKGVFVKATPETVAEGTANLQDLANQVAQLRTVSSAVPDVEDVRDEVAELRWQVARLEANLIALYGRVGQPYPRDVDDAGQAHAARRRAKGA